ncbi:MAG: nucleotidyltransferase domain-containing protein [Gammaproteobacteria bacterium]|nr:nucleotidyltransferase domain-containing protein [Gammaproteobacteria bacterium]
MKPAALDQLLPKMVETIVTEVDPEQVILFGSHARGDASEDSDVDLIVVESEPFDKNRDRGAEAVRLWRALAGFSISKDILVYSRDEVEYWRDSLNHVLARALREGRVLYERP